MKSFCGSQQFLATVTSKARAQELGLTVAYGKKAGLLNSHNRLSPLGILVGNVLMLKQS